jgi:predicted dehydrogenase
VDEFHGLGYVDELRYAVDCVREDRQPKYGVSGKLGLACLEVIKAMYKSAETGQAVRGQWG